MLLLLRLLQAWPLVVALIVLALVVYFFVSWAHSPTKAKEVLIRVFTVVTGVLSAFFVLASLYALFEHNMSIFELTASFGVVALVALVITRICRWRFVKNHPHYKDKPTHTDWV